MLTVIDEFTRECLAIHVARSLKHDDVPACLTDLFTQHGARDYIRSDNGSEFTAIAVREWLPIRSDDRGLFSFQDSYLLAEGKDFCVKRRAADEDFVENGEEDFDDPVHAGKGIRW